MLNSPRKLSPRADAASRDRANAGPRLQVASSRCLLAIVNVAPPFPAAARLCMHNAKKRGRAGCECKYFICNVLWPYFCDFRYAFYAFLCIAMHNDAAADDAGITDANVRLASCGELPASLYLSNFQ